MKISSRNETVPVGVKGVQLKRFERVVAKLLIAAGSSSSSSSSSRRSPTGSIEPRYTLLPPPPSSPCDRWPFGDLPAASRVYGTGEGQIAHAQRAQRKEDQLRSMLRCIDALIDYSHSTFKEKEETSTTNRQRKYTVVDFGGGSGHLAIPLALLFPNTVRVIVVDLSERSLALMHHKAAQCCLKNEDSDKQKKKKEVFIPKANSKEPRTSSCTQPKLEPTRIFNLFSFHGSVQQFAAAQQQQQQTDGFQDSSLQFDLAVSLHLCGEATDVVLRLAAEQQELTAASEAVARPAAIVVAPCCVGKLALTNKNPYIWQATGSNQPTIQ